MGSRDDLDAVEKRKPLVLSGIETRSRHYTDCTIPAHTNTCIQLLTYSHTEMSPFRGAANYVNTKKLPTMYGS
jgi:hypothetical protein